LSLVIDASLAAAWCFDDEATAESERLQDLVAEVGAIVPQIFPLEVTNFLLSAERRKRIPPQAVNENIELFGRLSLLIDGETTAHAWGEILALARSEKLTAYDACYLELALRTRSSLATLDRDLIAAARRRGVTVLP